MNVYVESNFVLELAWLQEQSASGEAILRLGEERRVHLHEAERLLDTLHA